MKNTTDQQIIHILMIENEQLPEWVNQHTVWVETTSTESDSSEILKERIRK